ncbi:MAG: hypothetical protein CSA13_00865 [Clostridiales bacterium]|nr:MAG: hypothetical protein CSA13_00865 [Clostridiales bacterium]
MKKRTVLLIGLIALALLLATACTANQSEQTTTTTATEAPSQSAQVAESTTQAPSPEKSIIKVGAPKAPPILPVLKMIEDNSLGDSVEIQLDYWETPEQLIGMIQGNKNDMYAFPLTVIAKLYNKGMDVRLTNVNTWGVSYLLSSDDSVKTWTDLKGKKLYIALQSSPPDIMTQYFLKQADLAKEDVEIVYAAKTELAQMMIAGKVENGVTIEPLVSQITTKNPNMKVKLSLQDEWQRVSGKNSNIPTAGIGATVDFATNNRDLVVKFEEAYQKNLEWIVANPEAAGELAEEKMGIKKQIIMKAIPNMGMHYKSAADSKPELDEFYQMLYDFNPKTVGGKVPDENMYFK